MANRHLGIRGLRGRYQRLGCALYAGAHFQGCGLNLYPFGSFEAAQGESKRGHGSS
jgi:hypothetical protein